MKKIKVKDSFLAELRKVPIVQVACERTSISRNSVYRWKNTDSNFADEMEKALAEGEALVNDLTESQLLTLIKEKEWSAISFWLRHRNPKFRDKVEITTKIDNGKLTPEQEATVREALKLASYSSQEIISTNNNKHEQSSNSNGSN